MRSIMGLASLPASPAHLSLISCLRHWLTLPGRTDYYAARLGLCTVLIYITITLESDCWLVSTEGSMQIKPIMRSISKENWLRICKVMGSCTKLVCLKNIENNFYFSEKRSHFPIFVHNKSAGHFEIHEAIIFIAAGLKYRSQVTGHRTGHRSHWKTPVNLRRVRIWLVSAYFVLLIFYLIFSIHPY